jgi:hypothetical protein
MKVYTQLEYQMLPDGSLKLVSEKSFEYEGPVAQCLRAEQAAADSAEATARDTGAKLGTQAAGELGQLSPFLSREMHSEHGFDPSQMNEMLTAAGVGTGAAAGTSESALQRQAATTGNAAGATKSLQEMERDRMKAGAGVAEGIASQDVTGALAKRQEGAQGMQGLYGENLKGQLDAMGQVSGDINAAVNANKTGYLQQQEDISNTVSNAFASCPVEGSMYLMADNTKRPVETLEVGELIAGIDGEPQVIEEIQSGIAETVLVTTVSGHAVRTSLTHAYALPKGGFVVAAKSLGKTIYTEEGPSKIVKVEPAGKAWVFNIITNGSHTYRVDGVWSLGVGEAERHVGMNEWAKIGSKLMTAVA